AGAPAAVTPAGDDLTFTATRTMLGTDPEGPIAFVIDSFQDLEVPPTAGYQSTATTVGSAVIFDIIAPTLSITGLPADVQFIEPIPTTFQFDEDVSGFDANGIQVTNGIAAAFTAVDAATYTADIIPTGTGDLTVRVPADVATDAAGNGNALTEETAVVGSAWSLVWSDNFDVAGLNPARWTARVTEVDCPDPCDGQQRYRTERVTVAGDGLLTIEARDEAGFSSGIVDTKGNLEFTYGRVEIDARMPGTQGTLPSLRLLPAVPVGESVPNYGPWPQSGEIDIVNAPNLGPSNSTLEHTLRYGLPQPEDTATTATSTAPGVPTIDIIQYAIEWEGGEIRWFVNDLHVATQTQDNWYAYFRQADADGIFGPFTLGTGAAPFDDDFYLVIGLAVGDNPDSFFPQTLEIDAVRVYECANPVDPLLGSGCSTGTGVPPETAPDQPFVVVPSIEVYTDAPATLDFVEPDGVSTISATWNQTDQPGDPSNSAVSNISSPDGATNIVWNADIQAVIGAAFVTIDVGGFNENNPADSLRYLDLSGGEAGGEVLFRMRVNSASLDVDLFFDLGDRPLNFGRVPLDFVADGQWRDYSVKIADLLAASVAQGRAFDIADVFGLSVGATDGSVNLDLDDISIKVACRDIGGCEATPRAAEASAPPVVVYTEDFESLVASDANALGPGGADWQIFADVWDGEVDVGT
ncbi:MAG: family 16 glycosylhydrolase, partial [Gammaproteobacteria bacterium]|nr:family 16 glycosylhydrolase [Gammaproteobacteria bacterium]